MFVVRQLKFVLKNVNVVMVQIRLKLIISLMGFTINIENQNKQHATLLINRGFIFELVSTI